MGIGLMSETNQNTEEVQQNMAEFTNNVETQPEVAEVSNSGDSPADQADQADQKSDETVETVETQNNSNENANAELRPTFEVDEESEDDESEDEPDLSKYTMLNADNLDEDAPIPGQEYALFSFMSPEGIMNCNIRAFKFRGAFPTVEAATEHAESLKKTDKYFKIHCAESGKWVEFDPPEDHVEKVVAGNKKQQKIIDAQRKARMDKMNELAGRHKQNIDKTDRGAKSRIEESKKAGAAEDYANKSRTKSQQKKAARQQKMNTAQSNRSSRSDQMRERLRKKLEAKKAQKAEEANKRRLKETRGNKSSTDSFPTESATESRFESGQVSETDLQRKTEVVYQASSDLEATKNELQRTNANIDKIRKMMQKN